jgi:hypothetical protein
MTISFFFTVCGEFIKKNPNPGMNCNGFGSPPKKSFDFNHLKE